MIFAESAKSDNMPTPIVQLYSGGVDSLCLYKIMERTYGDDFKAVYFTHNLNYGPAEEWALHNLEALNTIRIDRVWHHSEEYEYLNFWEFEEEGGFIPMRNPLLATLAVMQGARSVVIGAVKGEESKDKSQKFFQQFSEMASYVLGKKIVLSAPLQSMTKAEVVRFCLDNRLVHEMELRATMSCYRPVKKSITNNDWSRQARPEITQYIHCGECNACVRRWIAFAENDIEETYAADPSEAFFRFMKEINAGSRLLDQPIDRWSDMISNNLRALITATKNRKKE